MKYNKSSGLPAQAGQASKLLLVLAAVVLVAVIITFLIIRMAEKPLQPDVTDQPEIPLPVYETTLGDIKFLFQSSLDKGGILRVSDITNPRYTTSQKKDLIVGNPGAKFIIVTIGAQNVGKQNTSQNAWDIENIIDSEGRNFIPLGNHVVSPWLPEINLCGDLLKPAFDPSPCTKIYEISKASTGLKVRIDAGKNNSALLDLITK